jgi:hypothetical protein
VPTPRARVEWARRVEAEYRSAATAAAVLHGVVRAGLPRAVADVAARIVTDELDHAELSHAALVALGGRPDAVALDAGTMTPHTSPDGWLAALVDEVLRAFCLGETFAVPLFSAMRPRTTEPTCRAALDRILRDEAAHRQFGWDALDALLALDPDGVRARVADRLPAALAAFRAAYGDVPDGPLLSADERAAGLLDAAEYRAIHDRCLRDDIAPRLARRGLPVARDDR